MTSNKFKDIDYRFLQIMKALLNGIPVYSNKLKENIWLSDDMVIVTKRTWITVHTENGKVVSEERSHDEVFLPVLLDNPLRLLYDIANEMTDEQFIDLNSTITLNEL